MAVKRGKSQARRNTGGGDALPGWAWLILGVVLTVVVVLAAPRFLKSDGPDGFFRPSPNPDAQPATAAGDPDDDGVVPEPGTTPATRAAGAEPATAEREFDFYTLLPGQEVAMSDAELAASAREEAARAEREATARAAGAASPPAPGVQVPAATPAIATGTATPTRTPTAATPAATGTPAAAAAVASASPAPTDARYILQAGAFGASGDAEALKAKIALLGLGARVESATIKGKTMYRVRMGPYGTASELAEAKGKLGNGGLPALAIREN